MLRAAPFLPLAYRELLLPGVDVASRGCIGTTGYKGEGWDPRGPSRERKEKRARSRVVVLIFDGDTRMGLFADGELAVCLCRRGSFFLMKMDIYGGANFNDGPGS